MLTPDVGSNVHYGAILQSGDEQDVEEAPLLPPDSMLLHEDERLVSLSDGAYTTQARRSKVLKPRVKKQIERRMRIKARRKAIKQQAIAAQDSVTELRIMDGGHVWGLQDKQQDMGVQLHGEARRVAAYCVSNEYRVSAIVHHLESDSAFQGSLSIYDNALHCHMLPKKDLFIFGHE